MTNLVASDFLLTDNGVEQKLVAEPADRQPLALVVLMQTGGAAPRQFQNYRTFQALVSSMLGNSSHHVALVTFDSRLQQIWNFPPRIDGVKHAFKNPEGGDHGAAILDALNCGLTLLEQEPKSFRRIILLLSQARDDGSTVAPEQVVQRLAKSNTTIYSVTFSPASNPSRSKTRVKRDPGNIPTLASAATAMHENTAAEAAELSGGEHTQLKSGDDLNRTLSILATDFSNTYLLCFRANSGEAGLHAIQTRVIKPHSHLKVAARTIYWIDPMAKED
jgi:hypothetical protein